MEDGEAVEEVANGGPRRTSRSGGLKDEIAVLGGVAGADEADGAGHALLEFNVGLESDRDAFQGREVAGELECPIGTVMSRLHRARKQLQEMLADYAHREGYVALAAQAAA